MGGNRFVDNNWKLVSSHILTKDPWDELQEELRTFVIAHDDSREIWASDLRLLELNGVTGEVLRQLPFLVQNAPQKMYIRVISKCFTDAAGEYVVLYCVGRLGVTHLWRFDCFPEMNLRLIASNAGITRCKLSPNACWIAGMCSRYGQDYYARWNIDHRVFGAQMTPMELRYFGQSDGQRVLNINDSGAALLEYTNFDDGTLDVHLWNPDGSLATVTKEKGLLAETYESFGETSFHILESSGNATTIQPLGYHGASQKIEWPSHLPQLYGSSSSVFDTYLSLLQISSKSHLKSFLDLRGRGLLDLRWNVGRKSFSAVWYEQSSSWKSITYLRTELRVVAEEDSLVCLCAAKLAREGYENKKTMIPKELYKLISNFRNSGRFFPKFDK